MLFSKEDSGILWPHKSYLWCIMLGKKDSFEQNENPLLLLCFYQERRMHLFYIFEEYIPCISLVV